MQYNNWFCDLKEVKQYIKHVVCKITKSYSSLIFIIITITAIFCKCFILKATKNPYSLNSMQHFYIVHVFVFKKLKVTKHYFSTSETNHQKLHWLTFHLIKIRADPR